MEAYEEYLYEEGIRKMMNKMIIYSSQYGTSKQYATELSQKKAIPMYYVFCGIYS